MNPFPSSFVILPVQLRCYRGVGPVDFYHKTVGAVVIADSTPGIYREPLGSEAERSEN